MKKKRFRQLTASACALALALSLAPAARAARTFSDVPSSHWAYGAIMEASEAGVAAGYGDGTFLPGGEVTYAQFAAFLARAFCGSPTTSASDPWYKVYIDAVSAKGVLDGTAAQGGKNLDKPMNRYDMALMLCHIMGDALDESERQAAEALTDWDAIPKTYQDAVGSCVAAGILAGMPDGSFSGSQPMNRAQACTVIFRGLRHMGVEPQPDQTASLCGELLRLVNAERAQKGLQALKTDESLTRAAQLRAADISKGYFEDRPDGSEWHSVFDSVDLDMAYVDESIVGGGVTAEMALAIIQQTPGAYASLLEQDFTHVGIGYVHDENGVQGCQDFWSVLYAEVEGASAPSKPPEPSKPEEGGSLSFTPVPMEDLANKKSLQKKATDEELAQAYDEAVKLVEPYAGLSLEEQLMGIATDLRARFEDGMSYSMETSHYNDPYGYFILGSASCAGCTRATGLCLNILGIPYEHVNENQYSHQWCRVKAGDTYWICDAYGLYCGPEPAPYTHPYLS